MARFLLALLAAAVVAVQAGGKLGHAAPATAEVFWRTVLPRTPLPEAILHLLRPAAAAADTSFVSRAEDRPPFDYQDYKRPSSENDFDYDDYSGAKNRPSSDDDSSERTGAAAGARDFSYDGYSGAEKPRVAVVAARDFGYDDYRGAKKPRVAAAAARDFDYDDYRGAKKPRVATAADTPFGYDYKAPSTAIGGGKAEPTKTTVFFHEEAVRVGERLPFHFPPASPAVLGFLPRRVADSVPFTRPALPGVFAAFGVSPSSATAAGMEATLRACDTPTTIPGESKFCATSLEALVERAMGVLGTRDVRPVTSTLPRDGAPLQTYTVRAVRPVEGGPVFVACHDEPYPYTVYRCHTTGPSRAYMVEMEGARGGGAVSIATICHTDTSMWSPEHVSFKLLGTKPGGTPVCHLMPYGHIIWAKNVKHSTA